MQGLKTSVPFESLIEQGISGEQYITTELPQFGRSSDLPTAPTTPCNEPISPAKLSVATGRGVAQAAPEPVRVCG